MSLSTPLTLFAQIPLDVGFIVDSSVLGVALPVNVDGLEGRVLFPLKGPDGSRPLVAPDGLGRVDTFWGDWTSQTKAGGQVAIERLGFRLALNNVKLTYPVDELGNGYARGLAPVEKVLVAWIRRFQDWGQVLARQCLSLAEPLPSSISAPSAAAITWVESEDHASWPDSSQAVIQVVVEKDLTPLSERVASLDMVTTMAALANDPAASPPPAVALVTAARRAAQRRQWRNALMELGTALEALLTTQLALPTGHKETLGPLTQRALKAGIPLPTDVQATFVDPRNAAVHSGLEPTPPTVLAALTMLDDLIVTYEPGFACPPSLARAHRPQRHDLHIITRPDAST